MNRTLKNLSFGFYSLVVKAFTGKFRTFLLGNSVFDYGLRRKTRNFLSKITYLRGRQPKTQVRNNLGPLALILCCPPFAILMWYTNVHLDGSFSAMGSLLWRGGFFSTLYEIWSPLFFGSATAWTMIAVFALLQLTLMRLLPGKPFYGPLTPNGNTPVYKANGVAAFLTTISLFVTASFGLNLFAPTIIYDHLGELLGALNLFSLGFCLLLYFKGRFFPSSSDHSTTKSFLFDYYWGTELYPRFFGFDVKMFTNCRFGMMGWGIMILSYAAKQKELYGLSDSMIVSIALQLIYIFKFFIWETGYLRSLDIMHDRAGFYICWGCLVWVPCIYTSPAMYLVHHPVHLGAFFAILILAAGIACISINYLADRQRMRVRASAGNCLVWGKKPRTTLARYQTEQGEKKENILLASGWWGLARHFHYVPELGAAFCWALPALFFNFAPYFYFVFLTILLTDRAHRDDIRCAKKYGEDWKKYCGLVRYKIIPGLY